MNSTLKNILKFVVFLGIGVTILYVVYQKNSATYLADCMTKGGAAEDCIFWKKLVADFKSAKFQWLVLAICLFTISNVSRAIRWKMLISPLGKTPRFINSFLCIILGYFANLGLPRSGEFVRAGTLSKYEEIPFEKVMGTVVVDRIFDVISILIVTGIALIVEFDKIWDFFSPYLAFNTNLLFVGIGLLLILVMLFVFRQKLTQVTLFKKIENLIKGFAEGLSSVSKIKKPWWFLFHSVNIWVMYFFMTYVIFFSFEPTELLSPIVGLVAFVFGAWGIVIPSPGGMGTYHFLTQTVLGFYGVNEVEAFSFANISFVTIQLFTNILTGILALILLPIVNRNYQAKALSSND